MERPPDSFDPVRERCGRNIFSQALDTFLQVDYAH